MTPDSSTDAARREPLADTMDRLFAGPPQETVSVQALLDGMRGRSYPLVVAVFDLPNCIPTGIPWLSTITGIPICIVLVQMLMARPAAHLPRFIGKRAMPRSRLQRFMIKARPKLDWLERRVRPRLGGWTRDTSRLALVVAALANAIVLALPIPFDNFFPAWAVMFFALALLERDGVMAMLGWFFTACTAAWTVLLLTVYREAPAMVSAWLGQAWQWVKALF
ncbi:MAG: exopolysaccharide biosynthesis protein [Alphaproteobacteria bacterium]|nr:exopolysaccharide biosynthesis protein [Alphaproteobacteria bacterium]